MTPEEKVKIEIIKNFGYAYRAFGLNKLMGHVVALLMYANQPLSLDEICENLGRSKGPVSQIMKRLRDKNLIRRVWQPDSRRDFYEIQPEVFENAFRNNLELIKNNKRLAIQLNSTVESNYSDSLNALRNRMVEMEAFYSLMEKHHENFLTEWAQIRKELVLEKSA